MNGPTNGEEPTEGYRQSKSVTIDDSSAVAASFDMMYLGGQEMEAHIHEFQQALHYMTKQALD
jgi:hypothetical protein